MQMHINFELINDFIKNNNLTVNKFCSLANISRSTFYNIKSKAGKQRISAIVNIAKLIDSKVQDLIGL